MNPDNPIELVNRTYAELQVGDSASLTRALTQADIELFAILSGDVNPAHLDEAYARASPFHKVIAHGMWGGTLISTVLGTRLPGPGTIYLSQELHFLKPVGLGDVITVAVTVKAKQDDKHTVWLDCQCTNQRGQIVITGEAKVMAPTEKVHRPAPSLPTLHLHRHERFRRWVSRARELGPMRCAVVHADTRESMHAAALAAQAGLIKPVMIGPRTVMAAHARAEGLDLASCNWLDCGSPQMAVQHAVRLAEAGDVAIIMQGDIEQALLLDAILAAQGGSRRLSHALVAEAPDYAEPLIITDAVLHAAPSVQDKRDIMLNAIDLAHRLDFGDARVAILSSAHASSTMLPSAMDARALCEMRDQGLIPGGIVDGPLSLEAAINPEAARLQAPVSLVAGHANVLLVPNFETGDMLIKQLALLADADTAGVVLGAAVPVVLNEPTGDDRFHVASAALAVLLASQAAS